MSDLISRQAAIDAVCGWCKADCTPCEFFPCGEIKAVQALPPAQPNLQPTCNNLATDTIYRQQAIDTLWEIRREEIIDGRRFENHCSLSTAVDVIRDLPSAQPERKRGEWTDDNACPFCGFHPWYERDIHTLSFCPNCGAKMEESEDIPMEYFESGGM